MPSNATTRQGIKRAVLNKDLDQTAGGVTREGLKYNSRGRAVYAAQSKIAKKRANALGDQGPQGWTKAMARAAEDLGYWDVPVRKNTPFYKRAKKHFERIKNGDDSD